MRLNIAGFERTSRRMSLVHTLCSEAIWDDARSDEFKDQARALRSWVCQQRLHYDQGNPNGALHDEASRRAASLFGDPSLLIDVSEEALAPIDLEAAF